MTKQEQIEEIKRDIKKALEFDCSKGKCKTCKHKNEDNCEIPLITDYLIEQGYQKLQKDSVVLTKEEYIDLSRTYIGEQIEQTRKETAKEILILLGKGFDETKMTEFKNLPWYKLFCRELKHRYGVEAEE